MQMVFFYSLTVKINCFLPLVLVSDYLPLSLLQVGICFSNQLNGKSMLVTRVYYSYLLCNFVPFVTRKYSPETHLLPTDFRLHLVVFVSAE